MGSVSASLSGGWVLELFSWLHFWHSQFAGRGGEKGRKHKVGRGGVKNNKQRLNEAQ